MVERNRDVIDSWEKVELRGSEAGQNVTRPVVVCETNMREGQQSIGDKKSEEPAEIALKDNLVL